MEEAQEAMVLNAYEQFMVPVPKANGVITELIGQIGMATGYDLRLRHDVSSHALGEDIASLVYENKEYICFFFGYTRQVEPVLFDDAHEYLKLVKWKIGTYLIDVDMKVVIDEEDMSDRFIFHCKTTVV